MNEAIILNNKAIRLLQDGKNDAEAVQLLERALQIGRDLTGICRERKIILSSQSLAMTAPIHHSVSIDYMGDTSFFLVDQAMEIRLPSDLSSTDIASDADLLQACCALIIFNLAITHHRHGHVRQRKDLMSKAAKLYLLSLQLAENVSCHPNAPSFSALGHTIFLLGMTCVNNLSHIYQCLGLNHADEAKAMLDSLASLLESCPNSLRLALVMMHPSIVRGVELNLHLHYARGADAAPAA